MPKKLKDLTFWNIIFIFLVLIIQYFNRRKYPIIDGLFTIGMFNLLVYLGQLVNSLGFFDFTKTTFINFASLVRSAVKKEDYQIKDHVEIKHSKVELNNWFLAVGVVFILISVLIY